MYLHLGQDVVVKTAEIIGIFDIENTTVQKNSRDFLSLAEKQGQVQNVSEELPRSFVVIESEKKTNVYITQLSCAALRRRAGPNI